MKIGEFSRVEVIDEEGRDYTRYGVRVFAIIQDEGRTLKVFLFPSRTGKGEGGDDA